MVAQRVEFLTDYQNAAYADSYKAFVDKVRAAETPLGKTALTEAVARYLFKLMAYKDEYEVARLHTETGFLEKIAAQFEGDYKLDYHLAPPHASPSATTRASCRSSKFGPWMLTGVPRAGQAQGPARHARSTSSAAPRSAAPSAR